MKKLLFILILLVPVLSYGQSIAISDFVVRENLSQNGKLAVIAIDTTGKADDSVWGTFSFTVNGFQQALRFSDGVGVLQLPIESSTFVFFKHKNKDHDLGRLYFIRKTDKGLSPYKLSGLLLILIPAIVLFIAYVFKRFLLVFVILAVIYVYFNVSKGLSVGKLLESFFHSLKDFF